MAKSALELIQDAQNQGKYLSYIAIYAVIMIAVSIVDLIIGAVFVGQCMIEPNIPIYLIVQGIVMATSL